MKHGTIKWYMCHIKTIGNASQEDKKSQKIRDIF